MEKKQKKTVLTCLPPSTAASTDTASRSLRSTSLLWLQRQRDSTVMCEPQISWNGISLISLWEVNEKAGFFCSNTCSYNQPTAMSHTKTWHFPAQHWKPANPNAFRSAVNFKQEVKPKYKWYNRGYNSVQTSLVTSVKPSVFNASDTFQSVLKRYWGWLHSYATRVTQHKHSINNNENKQASVRDNNNGSRQHWLVNIRFIAKDQSVWYASKC